MTTREVPVTELLQEFVDSRGTVVRVDAEAGVVRGVKILGLHSRNGRTYLPEALFAAMPLYEGAKVNVNHPKGSALGPRDYQDRIGVIRNVAVRPAEGMFGDFHFNPKHALAEQLIWDALHAPENVGFSHNVEARTSRQGERLAVEAIIKVQSVDLVADPATTRGLFESAAGDAQSVETSEAAPRVRLFEDLTLEALNSHRADLVEAITRRQQSRVEQLEREIESLRAEQAAGVKRRIAESLLREFRLPDLESRDPAARAIIGEPFLESLMDAPDEAAIRRLVEQRARLVASSRNWLAADGAPGITSREQCLTDGRSAAPGTARDFVKTIT